MRCDVLASARRRVEVVELTFTEPRSVLDSSDPGSELLLAQLEQLQLLWLGYSDPERIGLVLSRFGMARDNDVVREDEEENGISEEN